MLHEASQSLRKRQACICCKIVAGDLWTRRPPHAVLGAAPATMGGVRKAMVLRQEPEQKAWPGRNGGGGGERFGGRVRGGGQLRPAPQAPVE